MLCRSLFVLLYFFWPLLLSVLLYTDSDYLFGIFKLFFKPLFVEMFMAFNL